MSANGDGAPRGRFLLAGAALVAAVTVLLYSDAVLRGRVFYYRDVHQQWIGQAEAFVRSLAAGSLPLWNRWASFGQPLLANPNNEVYYPLTWANLVMLPWNYYRAFVLLHSVFSGLGMLLLARRLGASPPAALAAAAGWIASGPFVSLSCLWNHLAGAAWIPWAALAADHALASRRAAPVLAWGAALAGPVLAGSPETAFMAVVASGIVAARRVRTAGAWRGLAVGAAALVFGAALSAGQWVPSLALAHRSVRARLADQNELWAVPAAGLVQSLAPVFLDPLPLDPRLRSELFEGREPFLASLYLGLAASGLVLAAVLSGSRLARVLAFVVVASALVSLGRHAPVLPLAEAAVPGLRALRFPAKAMILAAFCWWLLAALGLDALAEADRGQRAVRVWMTVAAVVMAATAAVVTFGAGTWGALVIAPDFTRRPAAVVLAPVARALAAAAVAAAAAAAVLALDRRRFASRGVPALAAIVCVDVAVAHANLLPTAAVELFRYRPPALEAIRGGPPLGRTFSYDYGIGDRGERFLGHHGYALKVPRDAWPARWVDAAALRAALAPTVLAQWGIESAYTADPVGLFSPDLFALTWFAYAREGTPAERRLLDLGGVTRVAALHRPPFGELRLLARAEGPMLEPTLVFEVPSPLSRAYAVSGVRVAERLDALRLLADPAFDPRREVVLAEGPERAADPGFSAVVEIADLRPDAMSLAATLTGEGQVVVLDTWDPGWRATVDGRPAAVRRANVAFRAIAVPSGRHRVELVYRPPEVTAGFVVFLIALAGAAAVLVRSRVRGGAP